MRLRSLPWTSTLLSLASLALFLAPNVSDRLGYDRHAIADGEVWRLLTGHLVHWSAEHLGWSLLVFAVLGAFWEQSGARRHFLAAVVGSAAAISAAVWLAQPEMLSYRGLSGIDCALVVAVAVVALRRALKTGQRQLAWATGAVLAAYFLKVAYELATGGMVFVHETEVSFVAVPLAHLVGGGCGLLVALAAPQINCPSRMSREKALNCG